MRRPYFLAWFVLAMVATANGVVREFSYGKVLAELPAHQLSTATGILAVGVVVYAWNHFWPIASAHEACSVGAIWCVMTIAFEFGFGHFVAGHSWQKLLADYDLSAGRLWCLFLLWLLVVPYLCYAARRRSG